ncbi:MAG: peptide chain release factor-like protein [Victivallales bacterium]|nr:peptide chain release factor-like protein [Victivallales bacterium]
MLKSALLALADDELLKLCRIDLCRGTGPGGQKRNKTSTAVRITHLESGIAATDDATRSQHLNRAHALAKLRVELAVNLPPEPDTAHPALPLEPVPRTTRPEYPAWLGEVFSTLASHGFQPAPAAAAYGCSPSHLIRVIAKDDNAWQHFAQARQRLALPPLRRN